MGLPTILWYTFYNQVKLLWIRLCRWIVVPYSMPKASRNFHKALVIGDGLAMGIGDRVVLGSSGGVASRIKNLISQRTGPGMLNKRPRSNWIVANGGEADSTSHDWQEDKTLFQGWFGKGAKFKDSEVVLIMLGTQDILKGMTGMSDKVLSNPVPGLKMHYGEEDFCDTVNNLRNLCVSLLRAHPTRRVLLMDVTEVRGYRLLTESKNSEVVYRVNRQIVDMIQALQKQTTDSALSNKKGTGVGDVGEAGGDIGKRVQWVHGSPMKIVMREWAHNEDLVHLSPKGYREFARWVREPVVDSMLQVELEWWSKVLGT
mmetsp:Transcript_15991/g.32721  ORF Transcript_15991/g.32721 Transcript_15991/m.32721 type:complete len:315 (+) Transcript_15991:40-984(+)